LRYLSNSIAGSVVVLLSLLLYSCGGKTTDTVGPGMDVAPVSCVVVLPTQTPYEDSSSNQMNNNMQAGVKYLDTAVLSELRKSKVEKVLQSTQFSLPISEMTSGEYSLMKEIGEVSGCNNVLITTLSHFRQRQGGEMAAGDPASAAFEMKLIEADTGRTLWMSTFNETQSSLFENLFSFSKAQSRGFKWITVEELVSQGVQEKLQECPYLY